MTQQEVNMAIDRLQRLQTCAIDVENYSGKLNTLGKQLAKLAAELAPLVQRVEALDQEVDADCPLTEAILAYVHAQQDKTNIALRAISPPLPVDPINS